MVLSIIFMILNWIAFSGWMFVCYKLLVLCRSWNDDGYGDIDWMRRIQKPVLFLEGICVIEVLRILLGQLKGNFILGVILHAIRLLTVLETMVRLPNHWTGPFILGSWAITEIFRYPMYMFPNNQLCRSIRMVVPIVTFPIGAFSEAYGAYLVFSDPKSPFGLKLALSFVLFVNGALGPTMAYPALLKKGLPILGLTKKRERKNKKEN
mmetsp:Transcript_1266/g.1417  ORF Transcript_1266/g.1417 Transcript_1266/m.1417 type:complete len:208 (-) Transcript_1266:527-1150(-)